MRPCPFDLADEPLARYSYSVLQTCEVLNGSFAGTSDAIWPPRLAQLITWLEDRIGPGWKPGLPKNERYDNAVRELARAALANARLDLAEKNGQ